ncbi:MAG: DnaJ domain-containing protein [Deltaproteobacteria bacterium]|nr:DnaJ domain-containing protein [Deltaproteobacteria bacterium]
MNREGLIDYYEILQLSQGADQETIERVYRLLAKRYHPDNKNTGDAQKFDELVKAYRALSDPERRADYDAKYDAGNSHQLNNYSHAAPSKGTEEDRKIYQAILSMLYTARRRDAGNAGVGTFQMEKLLEVPEKYLEFHIWYLREKGWIQRVENGGFAITVSGVDAVIENDLPLKKDRLLPAADEFGSGIDNLQSQGKGMMSNLADQMMSQA